MGNPHSGVLLAVYPWTRLGHTCDWADNGAEYGLTKFLIEENAPVKIAFTQTTAEFISRLQQEHSDIGS